MNHYFIINLLILVLSSSIYADDISTAQAINYTYYRWADTTGCKFPFTYNGQQINKCIVDPIIHPRLPWCSLTNDFADAQVGTYCHNFYNPDLKCLDSYVINGQTYTGCANIPKTAKYKQCQTNSTDLKLSYCLKDHLVRRPKPTISASNCDPSYFKLSKYHSMCISASDVAMPMPLNSTEQDQIVALHNSYRNAPPTPAKYMLKLYWDDELAKIAQSHSDLCFFKHDLAENRVSPKYGWWHGQNMVRAYEAVSTPVQLFKSMYDGEKGWFIYGEDCGGNCLHYTQLQIATLTRMGCGRTFCMFPHGFEQVIACNFIHSQYEDTVLRPYLERTAGATTSDCKTGNQDGNLCDCGNIAFDSEKQDVYQLPCMGKASKKKRSLEKRDAKRHRVPAVPKPKVFTNADGKSNPPAKRDLSGMAPMM